MNARIADFQIRKRYSFYAILVYKDDVIKTKGTDYMQNIYIIDDSIHIPHNFRIFSPEKINVDLKEGDFIYIRDAYVMDAKTIIKNRQYYLQKLCNVYTMQGIGATQEMNEDEKKKVYELKDNFLSYTRTTINFMLFDALVEKRECSFTALLKHISIESDILTVLHFIDYTTNEADELNICYVRNWENNAIMAKNLEINAFYLVKGPYVLEAGYTKLLTVSAKCDVEYIKLLPKDIRLNDINERIKTNSSKKPAIHGTNIEKCSSDKNTAINLHRIIYELPIDIHTVKVYFKMYYRMSPIYVDSLDDITNDPHEICMLKENFDLQKLDNISKVTKKYNPLANIEVYDDAPNIAYKKLDDSQCRIQLEKYEDLFCKKQKCAKNDISHLSIIISDDSVDNRIVYMLPNSLSNENEIEKCCKRKGMVTCMLLKDIVDNKVHLYLCKIIE